MKRLVSSVFDGTSAWVRKSLGARIVVVFLGLLLVVQIIEFFLFFSSFGFMYPSR